MAKIIWIMLDSLRYDVLGCYGGQACTPVMDEIAAAGVRFDQAISPGGFTPVSVASSLAGQYPHNNGFTTIKSRRNENENYWWWTDVRESLPSLNKDDETMFDVLVRNGYKTLAQTKPVLGTNYDYSSWNLIAQENAFISPQAFLWMADNYKDDFMCYFRFCITHMPWNYRPGLGFWNDVDVCANYFVTLLNKGRIDFVKKLVCESAYLADRIFGPLITFLEELKILDDVILVIQSDHGDLLWDRLEFEKLTPETIFHTYGLYESQIRVPMIIWYPKRIKAGTVVKQQVNLIDIVPTLLDLLELKEEKFRSKLDGRSLLPLLEGRQLDEVASISNGGRDVCIRKGGYKLTYDLNTKQKRLCDIRRDIAEQYDIQDKFPVIAGQLEEELFAMVCKNESRNRQICPDTDKHEAMLRVVGYID